MQLIQFLRKKICACASPRGNSDGQGLILYRQLRGAENKLYEAHDCLNSLRDLHKKTVTEHTRLTQLRDELERGDAVEGKDPLVDGMQQLQSVVSQQQNSARQQEELHKKINPQKGDIQRLEAEHQSVQMQVRIYFHFESCQNRLSEAAAAVGQTPQ